MATNDWEDAERHAERAQQFYEAGQWHKALREIRRALSFNPQQSDWHFGMGLTLDAMQRYDEAIEAYRKVLELRNDDVDAMINLGVDLVQVARHREAITILERAGELEPQSSASWSHRIAAYARLGDHEQAEVMFYMACQIDETDASAYDHVAESLALRGELHQAIRCWKQALKFDPQYPDAWGNLARAHWQLGDLPRARRDFIRALRREPGHIDTLLILGELLIEMKRYAEAAEKFRRVVELDPSIPDAYYHLGHLAYMAGHRNAAEARFEKARALSPDYVGPRAGLARIACDRGEIARAREMILGEIDLGGHNPAQMLDLTRMLIELEMDADAERLITPVIYEMTRLHAGGEAIDKELACSMLLCRGAARLRLGKFAAGLRDNKRVLELEPDHVVALYNLAFGYWQSGKLRRAAYWLNLAEEKGADDPSLKLLRRKLLLSRVRRWVGF